MIRSKEIAQKYQQQQNSLLSSSDSISQDQPFQHSSFAKMNTGLFSTQSQLGTKSSTDQRLDHHEEAIKNILKLRNYHGLPFKELIHLPYKANGDSAFNLVNNHRINQLHNSMMSDEAFAEDLSDDHSPDECMSDEQISEDEQPLDFSIKSKKDDREKESPLSKNTSPFTNSSIDQVDGDWTRVSNSKFPQSTMFNSLNDGALSLYAQQSTNLINRFPYMNPLLLGESQSNLVMHSEPSSPEGLSSSSSTSSRSSSQGYYSGSSLNGANTTYFNIPSSFNQSIAPSIYTNVFNQTFSKSNLQAPPSYASLNFSQNSKQSSSTRNSNQQVRPSVIVSTNNNKANHHRPHATRTIGNQLDSKLSYANDSDKIVDSVDEHFRLSLGDCYNKMMNSTPTKDASKSNSFANKQNFPMSIYNNLNRSLSQDSSSTVIESSTSVDDHFAKALGETWFKLKKDSP